MSDESKIKQKRVKRDKKGLFVKGHTGNPGGLTREFADLRPLILESRALVTKSIHQTARLTINELTTALTNPQAKVIDTVVARIYSKAIAGSYPHASMLLDRLIGSVQRVQDDGTLSDQPNPLETFSTEVLTALMLRLKNEAKLLEASSVEVQQVSG